MKRILLALALLLFPSLCWAQCNGVFPNATVCGNATGSSNTPRPTSPSAFQGSAGGSNGQVQYNNSGSLAGFTNPWPFYAAQRTILSGSTVTASATTDFIIIINKTSGSATTVNLPTPVVGTTILVKDGKGDAFTNNITVVPPYGTIDGQSSFIIKGAYYAYLFVWNGTQWNVL